MSHLSLTQWLAVMIGSLLIVVLVEIVKAVQRALGKDKNAIKHKRSHSPDGFFCGQNRLGIFLEVRVDF